MGNVEVLVATIKNDPTVLCNKMNIKTNAVISCQGKTNLQEEQIINGKTIKIITTNTVGVGKNRNIALVFASGDYLLFSDDDVAYYDGYERIVEQAFSSIKKADFIVFNFDKNDGHEIKKDNNSKIYRLHFYNSLHYGTVRIAVKRDSLLKVNTWFSLLYGGGCSFSNGEDSLFILEMLRKGLVGYRYNKSLGQYDSSNSTWFKGYNAKFFYDKGVWLKNAFPKTCFLMKYYFAKKFQKESNLNKGEILKCLRDGIKGFKKLSQFDEGANEK